MSVSVARPLVGGADGAFTPAIVSPPARSARRLGDGSPPGSLHRLGELPLQLLVRLVGQPADDDGDEQVGEEPGDDLVQGRSEDLRPEVLPQEDRRRPDDHAGQRAPGGEPAPEEAEEDGRAEGGAEAGPGEGDQLEDRVARVHRHEHADHRDDEHRHPPEDHSTASSTTSRETNTTTGTTSSAIIIIVPWTTSVSEAPRNLPMSV